VGCALYTLCDRGPDARIGTILPNHPGRHRRSSRRSSFVIPPLMNVLRRSGTMRSRAVPPTPRSGSLLDHADAHAPLRSVDRFCVALFCGYAGAPRWPSAAVLLVRRDTLAAALLRRAKIGLASAPARLSPH